MPDQNNTQNAQRAFSPEIRRARIDSLTIYDVSDHELEILAQGSPNSIFLNFAIFLLSVAASFTTTLATTDFDETQIILFTFFLTCTIIGYVIGGLLLLLWLKGHRSVSKVMESIRKRLPPEGDAQVPANTIKELPGNENA